MITETITISQDANLQDQIRYQLPLLHNLQCSQMPQIHGIIAETASKKINSVIIKTKLNHHYKIVLKFAP